MTSSTRGRNRASLPRRSRGRRRPRGASPATCRSSRRRPRTPSVRRRPLYAHAGGSPQALATRRAQGSGQLVWNADEFRWGGSFHRVGPPRFAPHNLFTSGAALRGIRKPVGGRAGRRSAKTGGAKDGPIDWPWTFARDAVLGYRPVGGSIVLSYQANTIRYAY